MEKLSSLKPAFTKEGTVTAGNSSGINDGAACLMLASENAVKEFSRHLPTWSIHSNPAYQKSFLPPTSGVHSIALVKSQEMLQQKIFWELYLVSSVSESNYVSLVCYVFVFQQFMLKNSFFHCSKSLLLYRYLLPVCCPAILFLLPGNKNQRQGEIMLHRTTISNINYKLQLHEQQHSTTKNLCAVREKVHCK